MNFLSEAKTTMPVPTTENQTITIRASGDGPPSVRDGPVPERVVSVLFETNVEAWRRGWDRSAGPSPTREAIISASEPTRGATATTRVVPDGQLAYTVLGTPVDLDRVIASIEEHLSGIETKDVRLLVDDVEPLVTEQGVTAVEEFVTGLRERVSDSITEVVIGCSVGNGADSTLAEVFTLGDRVEGASPATVDRIDRLRRDDPTTFGYLRHHWAEAQRGIEACDRNYPQSKQVHAAISDPETTPRTLGTTLSGLVTLRALETWSETVGPTRYDLTAYRPARLWEIGLAFACLRAAEERDSSRNE